MTSSKPHQNDEISLREPLLDTQKVSAFAEASLISKAFWLWMNPLLSKAYKTPLTSQDVPSLSPQHKAEIISARFVSKWPKNPENCRNLVAVTLLKCFWKEFAFTAFLAAIRICVVYSGPLLLQKFMDFTSNASASPSQGYYLVILLLIAKSVEVLATHQFNFNSQKLGMLIRTALVTNLYKKGIKLSCSARQAHGIGQIVNYMAVDSQQLSDMMRQIHAIWQLPFQVCVALFLVYLNVGGGAVTAFVAIVAVLTFVVIGTKRNNTYQFKLMTHRDSRLKTTTEMLNHMRVVKLQAWEEFFDKRITCFRESEYVWLAKIFCTVSSNMVVMWTTPIMISCLTFGTAILMGRPLNAKTVFTTTTLIRMLQEAIWAFPEAMMSISQAVISLRRLDEFMKSRELVKESVQEVVDGDSTTFVQVLNGSFSWDDEGAEAVLREININIKQGQVAAIVGAVGSGKSSLLASILGEMNKLKGKEQCRALAHSYSTLVRILILALQEMRAMSQ